MFSTLSTYIWGGEEDTGEDAALQPPPSPSRGPTSARDASPEDCNDWVLVGETSNPAPGNLAGALPPLPGPDTPSLSSSSSEAGDLEAVEVGGPVAARQHRSHQPGSLVQQAVKRELRSVRSAQREEQRQGGKALTSKALKRKNNTVYGQGNKKQLWRQNPNLKMAGANKNLKQC